MMRLFLLLITLLTFATNANAELTIDISEPNLEISTGFTGDTLTLFGTAKPKGDIVILVKGPKRDTSIRRRTDILGLWINATSIEFNNVHGYYNVASSRPIEEITSQENRIKYNLGLDSLKFTTNKKIPKEKENRFHESLIQNKQLNGLFALTPNAVEYLNNSLFKTRIHMPTNVPLGNYEIEAFLFRNGKLIDQSTHPFQIKQIGMAATIHNFAHGAPFRYGISIILIALLSSFLAILLLRRE